MVYWVKVSLFDGESDVEEYGEIEEAQEAYSTALDMESDGALGDVARISYGKRADGVSKTLAFTDYE